MYGPLYKFLYVCVYVHMYVCRCVGLSPTVASFINRSHMCWQVAFLQGPKSREKASKWFLVTPSEKVASFISNAHIGKPRFLCMYVCKGPKS